MKIKKIIIYITLIIFFLILPSLIFFISNLVFLEGNNYIFANKINLKLEKIIKNNEYLKFKKADYYYEIGDYQKALNLYLNINCQKNNICFELYHNLGNSYYKNFDLVEENQKINFLKSSLSYYLEALKIKFDIQTKKNYDFVLKKLNELNIKKQQDKNPEQKKKEEQKKQENNENEQKKDNNQNIQPKGDSIKIDKNTQNINKPLSKEEKEEIQNYIQNLKNEEKENLNYNKPQESQNIYDILENDFFTPFDENKNDW